MTASPSLFILVGPGLQPRVTINGMGISGDYPIVDPMGEAAYVTTSSTPSSARNLATKLATALGIPARQLTARGIEDIFIPE